MQNIEVILICEIVKLVLFSGVILAMSVLIDGKNFNSGGHKFGAALELEA